uniref:Uncharacterized protein n=1 Tax=Arundo donax TaxID=35708 RepID=A0A0A9CTL5_ARUDO
MNSGNPLIHIHQSSKGEKGGETYSFRTVSILSLVWHKRERLSCTCNQI